MRGLSVGVTMSIASAVVALVFLEEFLRVVDSYRAPAQHQVCDCPYVYEPKRNIDEVNSLGLRGGEIAPTKSPGVTRVVFLGDSVVWGTSVREQETFVRLFERYAREEGRLVEAVNGGVQGFSPYNEYFYLKEKLSRLGADRVVLTVCMNDIVNPRLHWRATGKVKATVPDEALPNVEYDRRVGMPRVAEEAHSWINRFALGRRLRILLQGVRPRWPASVTVAGTEWPVFITAEDSLPLMLYNDHSSPEWRWLRHWIGAIRDEARAEGADFTVLFAPLSYQLDPEYPISVAESFEQLCRDERLKCHDLLPLLRARQNDQPFPKTEDVWHLTPSGHAIVARYLVEVLR